MSRGERVQGKGSRVGCLGRYLIGVQRGCGLLVWLSRRLRHEHRDQAIRVSADFALEVREGFLAAAFLALDLVQVNGQGTKQGEISRGVVFADLAAVFVLGAVAAVTLANQLQHQRWAINALRKASN